MRLRLALAAAAALPSALAAQAPAAPAGSYIRVNQVGYLPDAPKVAVVCSLVPARIRRFTVVDSAGRTVFGPARARADRPFGPCAATHRLDFSALRAEGVYRIEAEGAEPARVRVSAAAYAGAADTLLHYMREQRSGFNPLFRVPVHTHTDGILVDHPEAGRFLPVAGGWADASDYLQYVTTSANATYVMLMAYRDHPEAFADEYGRDGLPGANGVADVVDEARHGLEWLVKMYPEDDLMLNQLGDDRDHQFLDLLPTDSSDYGWGRGRFRPVYPCTGKPQGLLQYRNRADGYASTAGKYASAMALGARLLAGRDSAFAALLGTKARAAYELGRKYPGACQTAPGGAPYFYEEDNWADDMELGAAQLLALTDEPRYLAEGLEYAAQEPVTPWMGRDTARHYQYYPWHNNGHYELWRQAEGDARQRLARYYRDGLERVVERAGNGFRIGIPFIWCSNNLMTSFATQAYLYRRMTGDERYREYEQAALDWLLGTNPWGVSMVIGYPEPGVTARDPHSVLSMQRGPADLKGGLLDGPVYRSIYQNLRGIQLAHPDEYAPFNTGAIVYHDDFGDYSTNEPIMDGTANLLYLLATRAGAGAEGVTR
jgi:hypothetical protein